jgi:hypothetical protein
VFIHLVIIPPTISTLSVVVVGHSFPAAVLTFVLVTPPVNKKYIVFEMMMIGWNEGLGVGREIVF